MDGSRRADSFNFYKKVIGTDAQPVKLLNSPGKQHSFDSLPADATVEFTVTGANYAGEGLPSEPVSVVI